jgi:hypothetical protein
MRVQARRALENLSRMKVMKIQTPVAAGLRARPPASLAVLDSVPGINYRDQTVSFQAATFEQAYRGIVALTSVASMAAAQSTMGEALRQQPGWAQTSRAITEFRVGRWLDYESGRWKPTPQVPAEIRNAGKKFFGDT